MPLFTFRRDSECSDVGTGRSVWCAQGHAPAVTDLMVEFVWAAYTGILEQGIEQQRGAKPRTTKPNPNVSMLDEDLDQVSGGLNSNQKAVTDDHRYGAHNFLAKQQVKMGYMNPKRRIQSGLTVDDAAPEN